MKPITLLYSKPSWAGIRWRESGGHLRRASSFEYIVNVVQRPGIGSDPIERIIIEAPVDSAQFLLFLSALSPDFTADILFIDRPYRAFLSASADHSQRVLYSLAEQDIDFYVSLNRLTERSAQPQPVPAAAHPRRVRVLVAEDETRTREILSGILEDLGCDVLVARTGVDAIRVAQEQRPNVLLLDGLMPEMHGFEVARFVRGMDPRYRPRIVIITGVYKNTRYQNEARMKYGVDAYLVKPVTAVQIAGAIFGDAATDAQALAEAS